MMEFYTLGCGTIIPQKNGYYCSGYLLDDRLLFDCGPGIWHALCKEQICIPGLNYILFSHFHVDHSADLGALLLARYLLREKAGGILKLIGPEGLINWYSRYKTLLGDWTDELDLEIIEIFDTIQLPEYLLKAGKTGHTENSVCYRISDQKGKIFFYSGDSTFTQDVITLAGDADLAVIEASYFEESREEKHLTPALAGKIAARAKVKRLVMTHRYPEVTDSRAIADGQREYKGNIILAKDGLKISF